MREPRESAGEPIVRSVRQLTRAARSCTGQDSQHYVYLYTIIYVYLYMYIDIYIYSYMKKFYWTDLYTFIFQDK